MHIYTPLEKLNIEKIVEKFGEDYIINSKGNLSYNCPFCERVVGKVDTKRKFGVDVKTTMYNCFRCHTSGIIYKSRKSNSEIIVPFLLDYFKAQNINNEETLNSNNLIEFTDVIPINKSSVAYEYLQSRQITNDQIDYYNIMNGINNNLGRIIIPNMVISNWTDFYQGRSYINMEPKYFNPENVDKSNIVFNLHRQCKNQKRIYITEGVFSAIRAGKDAICIYGSSPSYTQIKYIANYNFKEIYCCLDGDNAGIVGNNKLAKLLTNEIKNTKIYTVKLPEYEDPADMGEDVFKEYCEKHKRIYSGKNINKMLLYFDL